MRGFMEPGKEFRPIDIRKQSILKFGILITHWNKASQQWGLMLLLVAIGVGSMHAIGRPQPGVSQTIKERTVASFEVALREYGFAMVPELETLPDVLRWAALTNRLPSCIHWLEYHRALDPRSLTLQVALADALRMAGQWERLLILTANETWLFHESSRLGYRALAERKLGNFEWLESWNQARDHVVRESDGFVALVQLISGWEGWEEQIDDLLWKHIHNRGPHTVWCVAVQHQAYLKSENLPGLNRLNQWLLEADPSKLDLHNNQVIYSMALGQSELADHSAETIFPHSSDRPEFALTLALHSAWKGDRSHAEKSLKTLPIPWLLEPDRALYGWAILGKNAASDGLSAKLFELADEGQYPVFVRRFLEQLHGS
jgi:hypothetical protein